MSPPSMNPALGGRASSGRKSVDTTTGQDAMAVTRFKLTGTALLVFFCGFFAAVPVEIVGKVYLAELILPVAAIAAAASGRLQGLWRLREFHLLVLALAIMLLGYIASDMVAGTSEAQYQRGWGRVLFVVTDFLCLATIVAADRGHLRWFALGIGIGGLTIARFIDHMSMMSPIGWKFHYAPAAIFTMSAIAYALPRVFAAGGFAFLGVLSMQLDARASSALCLLISGLLWTRTGSRRRVPLRGDTAKYLKLGLAAAVALSTVYFLLKSTEDSATVARRAQSSVGRFLYLEIGTKAILGSPIIGYGSWGTSRDIAEIERQTFMESSDARVRNNETTGSALSIHSQILQAWLEGGVGAGLFFLIYGWLLVKALKYTILQRPWEALSPIMIFVAFNGLWHLVMSPFAAVHRLDIAQACTVIVLVGLERAMVRRARRGPAPARMQAATT